MNLTAKAQEVSGAKRARHRNNITIQVRKAGGSCQFFQTPGGIYDFVSVVAGISDMAKLFDLVAFIESLGTVKVQLLPGLHVLKG